MRGKRDLGGGLRGHDIIAEKRRHTRPVHPADQRTAGRGDTGNKRLLNQGRLADGVCLTQKDFGDLGGVQDTVVAPPGGADDPFQWVQSRLILALVDNHQTERNLRLLQFGDQWGVVIGAGLAVGDQNRVPDFRIGVFEDRQKALDRRRHLRAAAAVDRGDALMDFALAGDVLERHDDICLRIDGKYRDLILGVQEVNCLICRLFGEVELALIPRRVHPRRVHRAGIVHRYREGHTRQAAHLLEVQIDRKRLLNRGLVVAARPEREIPADHGQAQTQFPHRRGNRPHLGIGEAIGGNIA